MAANRRGGQAADAALLAGGGSSLLAGFGGPLLAMGCGCLVFALIFGGLVGIGVFATNNEESSANATENTSDGSLGGVSDIPDSLKPIFEKAGAKHKVSPAFIAAIFWKEHGRNFPTKGPWASSPKGANGPFQFIEKTWEGWSCKKTNNSNGSFETDPSKICGYGQDGDGDGKADVQNLYDSAFAAADLLGSNGAAPNVTDLDKLRNVASRYNSGLPWSKGQNIPETADYVPDVIEAYQKFLKQM